MQRDFRHRLLSMKESLLAKPIETEHEKQDQDIAAIAQHIEELFVLSGDERIKKGYELYLSYRKFAAEMPIARGSLTIL